MATSAVEWLVLVPVFPFSQPIFTLQQPYWIGFLVHLSSAAVYPIYPWLRAHVVDRKSNADTFFARVWSAGLLSVLATCAGLALAGSLGREIRWIGDERGSDQIFMRHMVTHHQQGIDLAKLAIDRAQDAHLRALARLMVASQAGEIAVFQGWWTSWFGMQMPICSSKERATMPGFLSIEQIEELKESSPADFDRSFVRHMTYHHAGAVQMADAMLRTSGDLRLRLTAHAIRHEQQGEIALMNGVRGWEAVQMAIRNMWADNVNGGS
jgi:uncharacterized protein (DUF305 family)